MKKFMMIAALVLGMSAAAVAQPRAIGLRAGYGAEFSYQHTLGNNFIEGDLGWFSNTFDVHATYNFVIVSPKWTAGEWNVYAGPGVGFIGYDGGCGASINIQAGIDYTFNIPLQLSLDFRPDIVQFIKNGPNWFRRWAPCLGIRYRF